MSLDTGTFEIKELIEEIIPFNRFLGVELRSYDPEEHSVILALPLRDEHVGNVVKAMPHGGVVSSLVDAAAGAAAALTLDDLATAPSVSTIDMRVDYLTPARGSQLLAAAAVVRAGRRVVVVRTEVKDDDGGLIALGTSTFAVGSFAEGRSSGELLSSAGDGARADTEVPQDGLPEQSARKPEVGP